MRLPTLLHEHELFELHQAAAGEEVARPAGIVRRDGEVERVPPRDRLHARLDALRAAPNVEAADFLAILRVQTHMHVARAAEAHHIREKLHRLAAVIRAEIKILVAHNAAVLNVRDNTLEWRPFGNQRAALQHTRQFRGYTCFLKFCLALNSYIFTKNSSPTILVKERNDVKSVA